MRLSIAVLLGGVAALSLVRSASAQAVSAADSNAPLSPVDARVMPVLQARGLEPAESCTDAVFLRRVYLDVIGTVPEPAAAREFLKDERPDKRARLIEDLLARDEFADYWAMKWCDLLRVKSEFPINLWPNAVQAYHRWIRDAIRSNLPYDEFVRALLTSSGSNFRVPPVNFYRAVQNRDPAGLAQAVALTFMGTRLEQWPADQRAQMAAFFSQVAYKKTAEWKEEIVFRDPAPHGPLQAVFPDGTVIEIPAETDPREIFAAWLLAPDNPWFARGAVNRVWAWLLGRGIIHEPDDIRPDNPAVFPELLAWLEDELRAANYDLKHVYRLILNSSVYQQSSVPRAPLEDAWVWFACYPVRQLDAEVLCDALCWLGGSGESYSSMIPEPFTYVPRYQRTIALADGSITSPFLEMFGRPARDTGLDSERNSQPSDKQRLHLLNSTDIQRKIENSPRLDRLMKESRRNPEMLIRGIYLGVLSRYPTAEEVATAQGYAEDSGAAPKQVAADLVWALVNSKEFLYRH